MGNTEADVLIMIASIARDSSAAREVNITSKEVQSFSELSLEMRSVCM